MVYPQEIKVDQNADDRLRRLDIEQNVYCYVKGKYL
jgi:hypothetical protein